MREGSQELCHKNWMAQREKINADEQPNRVRNRRHRAEHHEQGKREPQQPGALTSHSASLASVLVASSRRERGFYVLNKRFAAA